MLIRVGSPLFPQSSLKYGTYHVHQIAKDQTLLPQSSADPKNSSQIHKTSSLAVSSSGCDTEASGSGKRIVKAIAGDVMYRK